LKYWISRLTFEVFLTDEAIQKAVEAIEQELAWPEVKLEDNMHAQLLRYHDF
jgi:hypothetical protein